MNDPSGLADRYVALWNSRTPLNRDTHAFVRQGLRPWRRRR